QPRTPPHTRKSPQTAPDPPPHRHPPPPPPPPPPRRHLHTGDATGRDRSEAAHVQGDVQRKAVPGHPAAERDADRGDLALADPHAAEPRALPRGDAEIGERRDEDALEHLELPAPGGPEGAEPDDRVAGQLPGPGVGGRGG